MEASIQLMLAISWHFTQFFIVDRTSLPLTQLSQSLMMKCHHILGRVLQHLQLASQFIVNHQNVLQLTVQLASQADVTTSYHQKIDSMCSYIITFHLVFGINHARSLWLVQPFYSIYNKAIRLANSIVLASDPCTVKLPRVYR